MSFSTRLRHLAAVAVGALAFALLPAIFVLTKPPLKRAPQPVTYSDGPVAGEIRVYSWVRPANPPAASTRYSAKMPRFAVGLPAKVDLRSKDVGIYNQGGLGSCTANGWAAAVEYRDKNRLIVPPAQSALDRFLVWIHVRSKPVVPTSDHFTPSRLFIYYAEREMDGTIGRDVGATVEDGAKVVSTLGYPPESVWPYQISRFAVRPSDEAYSQAKQHVVPAPSSVDNANLDEVKTALASGHPIVFGFNVYASFEQLSAGSSVYQPAGRYMGGHCVTAVGYDDARRVVIVRNSWGTRWGDKGYFYFPYSSFASQTVSDAWTIVESTPASFARASAVPSLN